MKKKENKKKEISKYNFKFYRLEEGKKIRDKMLNEKKLLENIKDTKLKGLNDNYIPDKYKAELARKKINI